MTNKIKVNINDTEVAVPAGSTVLQACQAADVEVPHFCYHERLDIAGNCRMCLVEVEGGPPKPAASCALPAADGMKVHTNTEMVEKARNGVMEFLLLNHPLDCPICDQGGECDLQDQAMAYGFDKGRTKEIRRAVKDKNMGPLIKTHMTRCIHCTRCVRFIEDIAGIEELGSIGRGENMEITTYVEKSLTSELSGNIVDLCPVGALTNKAYAFRARPWELKKTETIDVMDAVGSNIRVDSKGNEVLRVLPRLHEDVNEEWISDKTRHACDGLKVQRLDTPYVRDAASGKLAPASWEEAFAAIKTKFSKLKGKEIGALVGPLCDVESMFALKSLMTKLKSPNLDCAPDISGGGLQVDASNRGNYIFNTSIAGIEEADACLIIGSNVRVEAPLIMARLRKRWRKGGFKVGLIGPEAPLTLGYEHLGDNLGTLENLIKGTAKDVKNFAKILKNAKKPMVIVGASVLAREDAQAVLDLIYQLCKTYDVANNLKGKKAWNGFNVLHTDASRVGALDMGFVPQKGGKTAADLLTSKETKAVYLMGVDSIAPTLLDDKFVIYQGHHGDAGAAAADVVLPGAAYTEKDGIYVNTEGRVQYAHQAVFPVGEAKEDWKIIKALSLALKVELPFETLSEVRKDLMKKHPVFKVSDVATPGTFKKMGAKGVLSKAPLTYPVQNFYMTDVISKNSPTMAKCVRELLETSEAASPKKQEAA